MEKIVKYKTNKGKIKEKIVKFVQAENGCWIAQDLPFSGYHKLAGRTLHRLMYENYVEPIRENMVIRHLCNNPKCGNPSHLRQGTYRENSQDMVDKNSRCFKVENVNFEQFTFFQYPYI